MINLSQVFYARCPKCGASVLSSPFPRAGLENRTDEERLHAFDNWSRRSIGLLQDGVCPWCTSTVSHEFENSSPSNEGVRITHRCDRCAGFLETRPGENVLNHPAVTAFFTVLDRILLQSHIGLLIFVRTTTVSVCFPRIRGQLNKRLDTKTSTSH